MKTIGIIIPFYNTPIWGQTSLYTLCKTLEKHRDDYHIDIIVTDNTLPYTSRGKKRNFIKALSEPEYFREQGVKFFQPPEIQKYHGTSLNFAVRYFHYCDYLICWETDIIACSEDWLDTVLSYMEDNSVWMTGYENIHFNLDRDSRDWYIMPNPGIYRQADLLKMDAEILKNKDRTAYFGENYSLTEQCPVEYMNDVGVFSEKRGFKDVHALCPDGKGRFVRPSALYYENGHWLFYRMLREGRNAKAFKYEDFYEILNNENVRSRTEFEDGKFVHYWGGTRSWDFLTHQEANLSQINYVKPKIELEVSLWRMLVPEEIRAMVPKVFRWDRDDIYELDNLRYIDMHKLGNDSHHILARETANWFKTEFLDKNYDNLL